MARSYTRIVYGHTSKLLILRPARVLARDSGDQVEWNSEGGRDRGVIVMKVISDIRFKGYSMLRRTSLSTSSRVTKPITLQFTREKR